MTELTLSIFDPNTLLPHRGGIAGLALALDAINPSDVPFSWEVTEHQVNLSWECSDQEAILSLLRQTYHLEDGYLDVPALNLGQQEKYTFTEGVRTTFLQHGSQRIQNNTVNRTFLIDEGQPEITCSFQKLEECYYARDEICYETRKKEYEEALAEYERKKTEGTTKEKKPRLKQPFTELKEAFNTKGALKAKIPIKGHHLPGLVECFAHGAYQESPQGFLALVFLPLACSYYQLSGYRSAVVIPEIKNIKEWVKRRNIFSGSSYRDFRSSSSGESALRFLLQEKLIEDSQDFRVDYCEVYQLGKQQWDGSQSYLKQAVYRVKVNDEVLALYDSAFQFFKHQVRTNDKGETWLAISKILPWLCDNLITGKPWYSGFYDFYKQNELYERKGLISMSQYLDALEQTFFDKVDSLDSLLGFEGNLAALYFGALPHLLGQDIPDSLRFAGRNRRPPKDRFNAMLSFGYSLLIKDVMNAILTVGLEPALGFYHQPRTQAPPLALDLMEIFRVPLVDMIVVTSINRQQWDTEADFDVRGQQVWLSDSGRRKFINLYEQRKAESWKHPVTGYSLTYRRLLELEVRLLEKEWCGEGGLFGQLIVR